MRSCSVFTAPPGAHTSLKCAYVFTQPYSPREESFSISLKYIDVSRTTHTNLDVVQESRIDDYWNIDGSTDLSESWTGFTQFALLSENLLKDISLYIWSGRRLTRRQVTSRPAHLWPELWRGMSKNAKLREKHQMGNWKTKARECKKITRNLFHWPWGHGVQRNHKKSKKKIGNTNGSSYALQDLQEKQTWRDP